IMSSMFNRLKGGQPPASAKGAEPAPTKEDILTSLEQFGEYSVGKTSREDNNNTKRRDSHDRENMDPNERQWDMMEDAQDKPNIPTGHPHSYSMEWERHFTRPHYLKWLRSQAIAGELRPCRFRSICWRLFLEVLPEDMNMWSEKARQDREMYEALKNKLITNPRGSVDSANIMINNPLSQDEESPWNKFFQDNELRLTIKQDVIRTFPEIAFFRDKHMQDALIDVLFFYCRCHEVISYKQGMHELLAPIIFVLHYDHQAFLHASESETILYMFCQVMATVEPWYLTKDIPSAPKKKHEIFTSQPFVRSQELLPSSVIVTKLTRIQDYVLRKFDAELHAHLEQLEIAPQIYGIRWLRLLFGREFPMQDLLMLWDAIFADSIGFDLVDYIFVAMMLYIRDLLLASDYAGCLSALMKFPQVSDAHYFIDKALWLREPNQYPRPQNYCHQVIAKSSSASHHHSKHVSPPQNKRGSTASLSQVEDSMFRPRGHASSSSFARLDPTNLRSAQSSPAGYSPVGFSPDEASNHSSPTKFATLPSRGKSKGRKLTKQELEYHQQISGLQGQLNDRADMCRYCASKLDVHIGRLQDELSRQNLDTDDEIMVALAGIKLVRDVLNGTLKFSRSILEDNEEINISDNYYQQVVTPGSDAAGPPGASNDMKKGASSQTKDRRQRLFYMSSGDTSSAAESPESFNGTPSVTHMSDRQSGTDFELSDILKRRTGSTGAKGGHALGFHDDRESTAETSSQSSSYATGGACGSDIVEDSPNPLYRNDWAEDMA
ncbi:hypothetical protein BaRGS_00025143, partial [Batillaria attramentaria]